jgi:hypothetical protein
VILEERRTPPSRESTIQSPAGREERGDESGEERGDDSGEECGDDGWEERGDDSREERGEDGGEERGEDGGEERGGKECGDDGGVCDGSIDVRDGGKGGRESCSGREKCGVEGGEEGGEDGGEEGGEHGGVEGADTASSIDSSVGFHVRGSLGGLSLLIRPTDKMYRLMARSGRPNARGLDCFGLLCFCIIR